MKALHKPTGNIVEVESYIISNEQYYINKKTDYIYHPVNLDFDVQNIINNETTISGWITRDKHSNDLCLHSSEPFRTEYENVCGEDIWESYGGYIILDSKLFPEISWDSEPVKAQLTIKIEKDDTTRQS